MTCHDWDPQQYRYRYYYERALNIAGCPPYGALNSAGLGAHVTTKPLQPCSPACCRCEGRETDTLREARQNSSKGTSDTTHILMMAPQRTYERTPPTVQETY